MAYDTQLAERIRAGLSGRSAVREVRMFGGLSFMVDEKLAVCAGSHGDLMVRVDPARADDLVAETPARYAEMRGRRMGKGWLVVSSTDVTDEEALNFWIATAVG